MSRSSEYGETCSKRQRVEEYARLRNEEIENWKLQENAADLMVPIVGRFYRDNNTIVTLFGKGLVHQSSVDIVKIHNTMSRGMKNSLSPVDTLPVLQAFEMIPNIKGMRIDIGRTFVLVKPVIEGEIKPAVESQQHTQESSECRSRKLLGKLLQKHITQQTIPNEGLMEKPVDVVLYGFGRIGRLLARLLIEKSGAGVKLMLRAVVVRRGTEGDLEKRASLLRRDSVHGRFRGMISVNQEANAIIANGNFIHVLYADGPDKVDYRNYGISNAVIIDNTGKWRDEEGLSLHLKSPGASKVVLTAPGKGITTIVSGVNDDRLDDSVSIYSAASCTTNCITPVLAIIDKKYGIDGGHIETVHSFTNDQNLIDNYHPKERRGRSAVQNLVITETGAAKAVVDCLPQMEGKLTANAIRVPTPNVSLAILSLQLENATTKDDLNGFISKVSLNSSLQNQIDFVNSPEVVSSDFIGSRASGVVDGKATIVSGSNANIYVWYDNEFGYSCQVVRLVQKMMKIDHAKFPNDIHAEIIDAVLDY